MPVRIEQIWRYPVKSMIGGQVEQADLHQLGIVGDRTWAVRDHVRGGSGARSSSAGSCAWPPATPTGPTGRWSSPCPTAREVSTAEPDASERVSAALDHPVTLEALRPPGDLDHYRRGRPDHDDIVDELRSVFGRTEDEPLPDFSVFPEAIFEYESPPGTYYDAFPLMLLTTSALRSLRAALPGSRIDVRRFRPSIVVDTGDEPGHPEVGWLGRRLALGAAEVEATTGCPGA